MDELPSEEQEPWHDLITGTTKIIFVVTLFLILGVLIISTVVNEQPLWCLVVSLLTIALGKKTFDAIRAARPQ